jgi:hypothetical protein
MSRIDSLTQIRVRLTHVTAQVSPTSLERIRQAWAGVPMQYLGIQDAARKRRPSTQKGGAWAGCVFQISPSKIGKTVTQEKWDKARGIALSIAEKVLGDGPIQDSDHKLLEQQRGFLVHLTMTFTSLVPFLKGIHLTLDS